MQRAHRVRQVANRINLSTPLGLAIAAAGRARVEPGPDGLLLARDYALRLPGSPAFTVGDVVFLRLSDERLAARPRLLAHEGRHAMQYAWCTGPFMIVLYVAAALVSWVLCGDYASYNPFERLADLEDGGYRRRPLRAVFRRG
ncbi:MAG: hypothetical protein GEV11_28570 [Streptosporangiales bacterium]|nr:hypothetical protein [Streptosporangiales bacterium]